MLDTKSSVLKEIDDLLFAAITKCENAATTEFVIVVPAERHRDVLLELETLRRGQSPATLMRVGTEPPYRGARLCYSHDSEQRIKIYSAKMM